ncbi:hypothetical protein [Burkholderia multivorans]|uniref:hypothetical protein n=1 Tax=Burkholderia multivorans TaxID=87883 RepID=UPI002ED24928|nr:hypothetical protein V1241_16770 [Burkholderia multivorans]
MANNNFKPFAAAAGANVMAQADYEALAALLTGFQSGTAQSAQLNKVWRQSSIMAAVLAQFIVDLTGQDAIDDGTTATLLANLKAAAGASSVGVVGSMRNGRMSVAAASSTATFTADEIIVETALGGLTYRLPSFSKTINLATTGAGGMDTGTAPANGYVALYAIYNPTTGASALLARNATSSAQPEVYGGANMPAGYTASALVSVWPTNDSGQFGVGVQQGRRISRSSATVLSQTTSTTSSIAVELSIASAVPPNATGVGGALYCHFNTSTGSAPTFSVSPANPFVGANQLFCSGNTTTPDFGCPFEIFGISSQRLYYSIINSVSASVTYTLIVTKYEF